MCICKMRTISYHCRQTVPGPWGRVAACGRFCHCRPLDRLSLLDILIRFVLSFGTWWCEVRCAGDASKQAVLNYIYNFNLLPDQISVQISNWVARNRCVPLCLELQQIFIYLASLHNSRILAASRRVLASRSRAPAAARSCVIVPCC